MFVNNDGVIELKKPFPKRMTWKKALELSIQKWEFILSEVEEENDVYANGAGNTCALCCKAGHVTTMDCGLCPVYKRTGEHACGETPYVRAITGDYQIEDVQVELDFLKSLRK